jgi:hypothetical protein
MTVSNVDDSPVFRHASERPYRPLAWVPACAGMAMVGGRSAPGDLECWRFTGLSSRRKGPWRRRAWVLRRDDNGGHAIFRLTPASRAYLQPPPFVATCSGWRWKMAKPMSRAERVERRRAKLPSAGPSTGADLGSRRPRPGLSRGARFAITRPRPAGRKTKPGKLPLGKQPSGSRRVSRVGVTRRASWLLGPGDGDEVRE